MVNTIINKTSHDINIIEENGQMIKTFPRAKHPWRVSISSRPHKKLSRVLGIPLRTTTVHVGNELPPSTPDVFYITSRLIAECYKYRSDLLVPDGEIRNKEERIIGFTGLARIE